MLPLILYSHVCTYVFTCMYRVSLLSIDVFVFYMSSIMRRLLRLFILGVSELHFPKDIEERKSVLSLSESPLVKNILLEFLLDFLLLPYG